MCDPSANCAGVVYYDEGSCCQLTNGTTLRTAAVPEAPDLPWVMLYDDAIVPAVSINFPFQ